MRRNKTSIHGAVLILVLGMLMVLSTIVSLFLSDVMRDTFMRIQLQGKDVLRHYAYNALDTLISRLEHDILCDNIINVKHFSLSSVPTTFPESVKVKIELEDESGKIPLNHTTQKKLKALFCLFGDLWDGQVLMREYWQWLSRKSSVSDLIEEDNWPIQDKRRIQVRSATDETSKDNSKNKIKFPQTLLSYDQLCEIDKFREFFFDEKGQPNNQMKRLKACSSLWNTGAVNINSANKDVLEALSKNFSLDLDKIEHHLGLREESTKNPQRYKSLQEMNDLGHANLALKSKKQENNSKTFGGKSSTKEDAVVHLTIQPHTIIAHIFVEEADVSFQLNALLEISTFDGASKDILTNERKNILMNEEGCLSIAIKSIGENFL